MDALSRNPVENIPELYTETVAEKGDILRVKTIEVHDWIKMAQMNDPKCTEIYIALKKRSPETPREKEIFRDFVLQNGRIFCKTTQGKRWVIPMSMRRQILT